MKIKADFLVQNDANWDAGNRSSIFKGKNKDDRTNRKIFHSNAFKAIVQQQIGFVPKCPESDLFIREGRFFTQEPKALINFKVS